MQYNTLIDNKILITVRKTKSDPTMDYADAVRSKDTLDYSGAMAQENKTYASNGKYIFFKN